MNDTNWIEEVPYRTVVQVELDLLTPFSANPESRTQPNTLKPLLNSVREHGIIDPIKVSRDGMVGDGHRRLACARIIGLRSVPVVRLDMTVEEIFETNAYARPVTNREWLDSYAKGNREMPTTKSQRIDELRKVVGEAGIERLTREGLAGTHILTLAKRITRYIAWDDTDSPTVARVFWWMVDFRMQNLVKTAMQHFIDPALIEAAVLINKPLRLNWITGEESE